MMFNEYVLEVDSFRSNANIYMLLWSQTVTNYGIVPHHLNGIFSKGSSKNDVQIEKEQQPVL